MTVRCCRTESERSVEEQQLYDLQKIVIRQDLRDLCQKKGCSLTEEQFTDLAGYLLMETRKQYRKLLSDTVQEFVLQGRPKALSGRVSEMLFLLTTEERFPAYQYLFGKQVGNALLYYLRETGRALSPDEYERAVWFYVSGKVRDSERSFYQDLEQAILFAQDPQMELLEKCPSKFSLSFLLESLTESEQQELFFVLLEPFVKQDVMTWLKMHPTDQAQEAQRPLAELADRAAELYVWEQIYDNNISYWDNLEHAISLAGSLGSSLIADRGEKEYRRKES